MGTRHVRLRYHAQEVYAMTVYDSRIAEGWPNEPDIRVSYDTALWDSGILVRYVPERPIGSLTLRLGAGSRLRSGTIVYAGSVIGRALDTGHNVVIREESVIGDDVFISSNTVVDYGCRLGHGVRIDSNCYLSPFTTVEEDAVIGAGCTFQSEFPGGGRQTRRPQGPLVRRGARIGINVSILPGVVIGDGALIGSGSVITRDVPDGMVAAGAPAEILCSVDELSEQADGSGIPDPAGRPIPNPDPKSGGTGGWLLFGERALR
jgi:acetyltransferase-like isoleucine patch superfamily enzyme